MEKAKSPDPESFPRLQFRKVGKTEESRIETESLPPSKPLDYSSLISIQKTVDRMMTRELRRNFPASEIIAQVLAQVLENPAVADADELAVIKAVEERVRFNLQTRWLGW